ncbi:MAG TPA: hypothetical protein VHB73_06960, partial [Alphaproteobacteria bacterium]|nr:hypothetical protein [Alphaproteobacteria bacterium]
MNSQEHAHKSVTILAIALLIFTLFQLTQVLIDGGTLSKNKAQTKENIAKADKALGDDSKMLDQLNAIALGTQKLAEGGNANAKDIIA